MYLTVIKQYKRNREVPSYSYTIVFNTFGTVSFVDPFSTQEKSDKVSTF